MVVWQDSILSSGKTHENTLGILKDPPTLRNKILWSDELQFQASCLKWTSSAHHLQSTSPTVKCAGSSLVLCGCFQRQGLKSSMHQNIEIALMKTQSRAFRTSDWAEGSPSNKTMTQSTQLSERLWVAQPESELEPNQIFLEKPENVYLPQSNLTELERWRVRWKWHIIAKCWWAKLVALKKQKRLETVKMLQLNIKLRVWILMQCTYFSFFILNTFTKLYILYIYELIAAPNPLRLGARKRYREMLISQHKLGSWSVHWVV